MIFLKAASRVSVMLLANPHIRNKLVTRAKGTSGVLFLLISLLGKVEKGGCEVKNWSLDVSLCDAVEMVAGFDIVRQP